MIDDGMRRAGFWRRLGVVVLDGLLVLLPLQGLVALAFALTDGAIQGRFGVTTTVCAPDPAASPAFLAGLRPAPPDAPDAVVYCQTRFVGFPTAAALVVTKHGHASTVAGFVLETHVSTAYATNADRRMVEATDLDIPAYLAVALAVVWQWAARGRTLGGRLLRLRVIRTVSGGAPVPDGARGGIGWGRACKRLALSVAATCCVAAPAVAVALGLVFFVGDGDRTELLWVALGVAVLGLLAQGVVSVIIVVDIVTRRDPIYDRRAKTAAVVG
jgi:hypothetical protein